MEKPQTSKAVAAAAVVRSADVPARANISDSIAISRVICILGIVYVHAWTGLTGSQLVDTLQTSQSVLRWTLMELFGRSAVPLLGVISGWLVAGSATRRSYSNFISGKARTILLPMVLWNAIGIILVSGAAYLGVLRAPFPDSPFWVVDELFSLVTPENINVQMGFLRDLFLCMCIAPLLMRLPSQLLVAIGGLIVVWLWSGNALWLLQRPQILLFFIAGMLVRRTDLAPKLAELPILSTAIPFLVLVALRIHLDMEGVETGSASPAGLAIIDLPIRFAAALFYWRLASFLATLPVAQGILRLERYAFLMFCSHLIIIWFGGALLGQLTGPLGSPAYPFLLVFQPLLALAAAIILGTMLCGISPAVAKILSGGRLNGTKVRTVRFQRQSNF